jgi:hypothetical protein
MQLLRGPKAWTLDRPLPLVVRPGQRGGLLTGLDRAGACVAAPSPRCGHAASPLINNACSKEAEREAGLHIAFAVVADASTSVYMAPYER